jgi:hypothetical protein
VVRNVELVRLVTLLELFHDSQGGIVIQSPAFFANEMLAVEGKFEEREAPLRSS